MTPAIFLWTIQNKVALDYIPKHEINIHNPIMIELMDPINK